MKKFALVLLCIIGACTTYSQGVLSITATSPKMLDEKVYIVCFDGFKVDTVKIVKITNKEVNVSLPKMGFYRLYFKNTFSFPVFLSHHDIGIKISELNYPDKITDSRNQLLIDMLIWERELMKQHYYKKNKSIELLLKFQLEIENRISSISDAKIKVYLRGEFYSNPYWFPFSTLSLKNYKSKVTNLLSKNIPYLKDTDLIRMFGLRFNFLNQGLAKTEKQYHNLNKIDFDSWLQMGIIKESNSCEFNLYGLIPGGLPRK
jgi:hypothetical protein